MKECFRMIMVAALMALSASLHGQACSPDTAMYPNSGIYPNELPPACTNAVYEAVITVNVPPDTTIMGFTVPLNWVRLDSIIGLPPGFTYACEPDSCVFPGNSSGCVIITGTATVIDSFDLDLAVTIEGSLFGTPTQLPSTLEDYYTLVVQPGPAAAVASTQDESCLGAGDGGFTMTTSGGTPPYEFSIDGGMTWQTDSVFSGISAGMYDVSVTDSGGCVSIIPVVVGEQTNPVTIDSLYVEQITCFGENDGLISVDVTGNNADFSFEWDGLPAETDSAVDNLGPGTYMLTVTDANGCQKVEDIVIEEPDSLALTLSSTSDNGTTNGTVAVMATGGTPNYTYLWSTGDMTDSVSGLAAGVYTVTVEDEFGCTTVDSVEVQSTVGFAPELFTQIKLYPNPNSGSFAISLSLTTMESLNIRLVDMQGKQLWQDQTERIQQYQQDIQLEKVTPGIYFLQLSSAKGFVTKKVIIH